MQMEIEPVKTLTRRNPNDQNNNSNGMVIEKTNGNTDQNISSMSKLLEEKYGSTNRQFSINMIMNDIKHLDR